MTFDENVFGSTTLSSLLEEIHGNSAAKRVQINEYIKQLVKLIRTPEDATMISPIIKDFMDVAVKNDDSLIKIATIAQRLVSATVKGTTEGGLLSEQEKLQLLDSVRNDIEDLHTEADKLTDVADDKIDSDEFKKKLKDAEDELDFMRVV